MVQWLALALTVVVCLPAADIAGAAKVIELSGQVSVWRDVSPWALSLGDSVPPGLTIISGPDGSAIFQVSDGSTFEVYPNSRVVFRDNPGNWKDLLEVFIGRIKVHIQKLNGQPNYNRVRTPTAVISVRGTVFDVDVEDEDATTLVMVDEGQVAVQHALQPRGNAKVLNSGEWIRVYKNQPLSAKKLDKGTVLQGVLRAGADALSEVLYRTRTSSGRVGIPGGPTAGGGVADTTKGPAPPAPPPPPPPPPQ